MPALTTRTVALALALPALAVLSACSSSATTTPAPVVTHTVATPLDPTLADQFAVKTTVQHFYDDMAHGDIQGACGFYDGGDLPLGVTKTYMLDTAPVNDTCLQFLTAVYRASTTAELMPFQSVLVAKATVTGTSASVADADITTTNGAVLSPTGMATTLSKASGTWRIVTNYAS